MAPLFTVNQYKKLKYNADDGKNKHIHLWFPSSKPYLLNFYQSSGFAVLKDELKLDKSSFKNSQGLSFAIPSNYVCIIHNLFKQGKDPSPINLPLRFAEDREAENYKKVSSFFYNGKNIEIFPK